MGALVCLSGILADRAHADEPPATTNIEFQRDGRFLGYTRLREGTSIPATLGKVVALGPRRWAFVPLAKPGLKDVEAVPDSDSVKITVNQQREIVTGRVDPVTLLNKISTIRDGDKRRQDNVVISAMSSAVSSVADESRSEPIVLIAENLMLQRLVQAIREDELDSLWRVTGRVTEYFGENRLTILTAQRGQVKQLPSATAR